MLDCGKHCHAFNLGSYSCVISGFTITNGLHSDKGGGIYCSSTDPQVSNCIFSDNRATYGGGIYYGTVSNCTFRNNEATENGGGAYGSDVYNSVFSGNRAINSHGGAMCQGVAYNCIFTNNYAGGNGGALYAVDADFCRIMNNTAAMNAGGANSSKISHSLISENLATYDGGGMYMGSADNSAFIGNSGRNGGGTFDTAITNCTLAYNTATQYGGGMNSGSAINSILWYNRATNSADNIYNGSVEKVCSPDVPAGYNGCITNEPSFVDGVAGNLHLQSNSPCINAGTNSAITSAFDLDASSRVCSLVVDLGAYEFNPGSPLHYVSTNSTYPAPPYDSWLTAARSLADAVKAVADGDTVIVSNGIYLVAMTAEVTNNITVKSLNGPTLTVIDGQNIHRAFHITPVNCNSTISGFSLTNCYTQLEGGAIYCRDFTPVITNCLFMNNTAGYGGAIARGTIYNTDFYNNHATNFGGAVFYGHIHNCRFYGNSTENEGGAIKYGIASNCLFTGNIATNCGGATSSAEVKNSVFENNSAKIGGGSANGVIYDCAYTNNSAANTGGGAYFGRIYRCRFYHNSSQSWGGALSHSTVYSSLFLSNDAQNGGGAAFANLNNCTLINNSAGTAGGGTYGGYLTNCIICCNSSCSKGTNIYATTSLYHVCSPDVTNGVNGCTTRDPRLNYVTFEPLPNSPCVDAGGIVPDGAATDYYGKTTPIDGNCDGTNAIDIGCCEYNPHGRDYDNDGMEDCNEFIAGTNPEQAGSVLRAQSSLTAGGFVISWVPAKSRTYTILRASYTATNNFLTLRDGMAYPQNSYTDTTYRAQSPLFYKISVERQ